MALNHEVLEGWVFDDVYHEYNEKDVILYALGLGLGRDPLNRQELAFVYESGLKVLPTMTVVMGTLGMWVKDPQFGINWVKLVHSQQSAQFVAPLPPKGRVVSHARIKSLHDLGEERGALLVVERKIADAESGELYCVLEQTLILRGDGGYGGQKPQRIAFELPQRAADASVTLQTEPGQAIIYRLSGDWNPLHIDLDVAAKAGFKQPILHGFCSYGLAGVAVMKAFDIDETQLAKLDVKFSRPVYPGQSISFEFWKEGQEILFRGIADGVTVLDQGRASIRDK